MLIWICEDDKAERAHLNACCERYAREQGIDIAVQTFADGEALLQSPRATEADVLLLDIYLGGIDGLEVAGALRARGFAAPIVLVTHSREHYAQGYEVEALHYLVKPVAYEAFEEAMRRVRKHAGADSRVIRVPVGRDSMEVPVSSILYAEVAGHETRLHTRQGIFRIRQPLSALEEALWDAPFLRCYRSYLVNMAYIARMEEDGFLMHNGKKLPIARDIRPDIRRRYMAYLFAAEKPEEAQP